MYKTAINRPITTLMFAFAIIFFGVMGFKKLSVALFPNIDIPTVVVTTTYPGASAEIIESKVTDKIEEAVMGIDGIKKVTSTSSKNVSIVVIEFELEKPNEEALNDVVNKISSVRFDDSNIQKPSINKFDTNSQAIISLFVSSSSVPATTLNDYAKNTIKPMLQKISGVGGVQLNGFRERQIRIYADPTLMNKYNLTYADLFSTLKAENVEIDGGRIVNSQRELSILINANSYSVADVEKIQVGNHVRLGDIAKIEIGLEEDNTFASFKDKPGVILEIQKVAGSNEIEIVDRVYEALKHIQAISPSYEIRPFLDTTSYIRTSIEDVKFDLVLGAILAVLVVFAFLRNGTITLVSAISIPISIMGTFALIQWMGFSLNMLTMVALTLAIGIIIDDAIVVIENIHKKLEMGMDKRKASYEGVKEIGFALVAISAMLLSVFVPIGNMKGIIGRFFQSFGITVALAIALSYVVVVTIIPMVSSVVVNPRHSRFYVWSEPFFKALESYYTRLLQWVLNHKLIIFIAVVLVFVGSLFVASKIGMEFMLKEDRGRFLVWLRAKPGVSIDYMTKKAKGFQEAIEKHAEVEFTTLQVGYGTTQSPFKAKIFVQLKPLKERKKERKLGQFELMRALRSELKSMPEAKDLESINLSEVPLLGGGGDSSPFQTFVFAHSQEAVDKSVANLKKFLLESPELKGKIEGFHTSTSESQPQLQLKILRQNANKYGVSAQTIGSVVSSAFSGTSQASVFKQDGKEYDMIIRVPDNKRVSVEDIKRLQVRNKYNKLMFLDALVEITETKSPSSISRYNRQRSVTVLAQPKAGISLGEILTQVSKNTKEWLVEGANYRFTGEADNAKETNGEFLIAIATAFVLIYMILAALYESILEPFIIMVTMPLSFSGAFFALGLVHQPLSMFSMIGLILLIGMVGKNATLLIDVANEERKKGLNIQEAILFAGKTRLRPILMTTIAMVCGMLPLALASGDGAAMKSPIGIAMSGGLMISMVLSLLIVPVFYRLLAPIDDKIKRFYQNQKTLE
ncbi:efflux RND transporter permease subunit HefC [Helicobacter pylori]|uniref:Cytoplasmic pump protein of the hefABC efflux system HefC n=1 Tax=Helicobacter pylori Aklavik86 TaxID=1055532 RepID=K7YM55_HELPX|nr:efflux RND transporter permease subunit HefC [Helicobacter pylori]AFX89437.1 cytoplasmic pump protein of the hefABC efflux system HefC [Helicobacter pylori Aklavik86]WQS14685.1 efflux RND transporter permease subunit HefC [Helicobacter pylori]WQS24416.1 efflux RND transporter permease subunit HefC [Helicobacter pylori]